MSTQDRPDNPGGMRRNKRARLVCMRCHEKKVSIRISRRGTVRKRGSVAEAEQPDEPAHPALPRGVWPLGVPAQRSSQQEGLPRVVGGPIAEDANTGILPRAFQTEPSQTIGSIPFSQPSSQVPTTGDGGTRELPNVTPGQLSQSSQTNSHRAAYLGESGYMAMFSHETAEDEAASQEPAAENRPDVLPPVLQESYLETYFDYCYTWCPILDRATMQSCPEFGNSMLLREALALLGSHLRPPLMPHPKPRQHYYRTRRLFYDNDEDHPLLRILAVMLLYWWSSGPPNVASIDTNWWWMGVSIRLAQEIGVHREQDAGQQLRPGETTGLRRRIWWTLFILEARERLTSIMLARPCVIDPDYCNVKMVTAEDFPDPTDPKAEIFIHWVQLCEVIGRVGKAIAQGKLNDLNSSSAQDLVAWARNLSSHLQLPISNDRTTNFNRDIHLLHLPYLATTILLHLQKGTEKLPRASATAIVAASCVARIFADFLGRSTLRFVPGQAGWYISIAILALLNARQAVTLTVPADADIATLRTALKQMATRWHSSKMFYIGFEKILDAKPGVIDGQNSAPISDLAGQPSNAMGTKQAQVAPTLDVLPGPDTVNWTDCFPYATTETSPLIAAMLANTLEMPFTGWDSSQFTHLFDFLDGLDPELLEIDLNL
ncbi:hypothetical protein H2200_008681 [Cladophialophora chaetospira]|uniref:Xylanolytic transcriptional activator regulatory domain-containing protein n=1 Tax=Cladophialophora chaetospira TaxID=386627 RepID=A0AA38X4U0_9EURO|nr:hypothetical protein H2200_008681 [Cladophialophora chaetospira]